MYSSEDVFAYLALRDETFIVKARKVLFLMLLAQYKRLMMGQLLKLLCNYLPITKVEFLIHERTIKPLDPQIPFRASRKYGFRMFEGEYDDYLLRPPNYEEVLDKLRQTIPRPVIERLDKVASRFSLATLTEVELEVFYLLGFTTKDLWECGGLMLDECLRRRNRFGFHDICFRDNLKELKAKKERIEANQNVNFLWG